MSYPRRGRLLAALLAPAATVGLLVVVSATAFADEPAPPPNPNPAPITLTPEQSARVCNQLVPRLLTGIDRWKTAVNGDASTPGSGARLKERARQARATGHPAVRHPRAARGSPWCCRAPWLWHPDRELAAQV